MPDRDQQKRAAAQEALQYIENGMVLGVGTGSTVNYFIDALASIKGKVDAAVASSKVTETRLKSIGIPVYDLNSVGNVPLYIDGADEFNHYLNLIKGGGAALTREKIIAAAAEKFICIADDSKQVQTLGQFPLPVEVIPMARGYVARELVKLGGDPVYRPSIITENGNIILDVHNLDISQPVKMEEKINNIVGVVTNGIFAKRSADTVLLATNTGVKVLST